jgi:Transposase DDE domain group 1
VLDIDDTVDVVQGHQQLAQWNALYDQRCFLPIHVYDAATGAPVVVIPRPGRKVWKHLEEAVEYDVL